MKDQHKKKILLLLRRKRTELKHKEPGNPRRWTEYLKRTGITRTGVTGLARMIDKGLEGKFVIQTDTFLSEPRKKEELEGMDATDLSFLVMDTETKDKILVLGLP